ncbi:hypothetical protein ISN45_Aa07g032340 [Arabidopsis thaliana x Arabidopsis arenosa]|uniref:Uncharacterized protein n=1 Tax=Arabidopsis thaliana x Arabidopsis arenosa TaxID=1240361 RepID=A0A8T1Y831_9BRAS|nr:hypothetical protein ISN45_Aa07g032340 [Arabidopsis thaliana x Arabidopsis arenosa]
MPPKKGLKRKRVTKATTVESSPTVEPSTTTTVEPGSTEEPSPMVENNPIEGEGVEEQQVPGDLQVQSLSPVIEDSDKNEEEDSEKNEEEENEEEENEEEGNEEGNEEGEESSSDEGSRSLGEKSSSDESKEDEIAVENAPENQAENAMLAGGEDTAAMATEIEFSGEESSSSSSSVLTLGISPTIFAEMLGWHYNDSGLYTVKSGYWLATHLPDYGDDINPPPGQQELKEALWKMKIAPKLQHFLCGGYCGRNYSCA